MRIDAHQHYWRLDRGDYDWLTPELGVLHRDYLPAQLEPLLRTAGVCATVLVQAAASEAETRFLAQLAHATPTVAGVVGWFDMEDVEAPSHLDALRADCDGMLKGVRPMVQDIPDDQWLGRDALDPAFDAIIQAGLAFDALVLPRHLDALLVRLERHPRLRTVIDHCAKPDIARGRFSDWARALHRLAEHPGVHCKLSGLLTQMAPGQGVEALRPYVAKVLEIFGPRRILWGSDWPVLGLRAEYGDWLVCTRALLTGLDHDEQDAIFGGNAARFYRLSMPDAA